jgi:hypothetical protein
MIGYHAFQPLADTLYYIADQGGLGTTGNGADIGKAVFSPFKMLHLAATMDWGIPLSKRLSINPGLHVGMLYAQRSIAFQDNGGEDGIDELVTWATLNGQAGLEYKHISALTFSSLTLLLFNLATPIPMRWITTRILECFIISIHLGFPSITIFKSLTRC